MFTDIFNSIGDMALDAMGRVNSDYEGWLKDFRTIIETVPTEVATLFGEMKGVEIVRGGSKESAGIILSATDYLWWKVEIEKGCRFVKGTKAVRQKMIERLVEKVETVPLEPKERKALLALMDGVK